MSVTVGTFPGLVTLRCYRCRADFGMGDDVLWVGDFPVHAEPCEWWFGVASSDARRDRLMRAPASQRQPIAPAPDERVTGLHGGGSVASRGS